MKHLFLLSFCSAILLFTQRANAQGVGVGDTDITPAGDVLLELRSSGKGFLSTRMTQAQMLAIPSPSSSLIVYQTDGTPGFRYYTGSAWVPLGGTDNLGSHVATEDIVMDDNKLVNASAANGIVILDNGNVGIGKNVPSAKLEVSKGDIQFSSSAGVVGGLEFENPAGTFSTTIRSRANYQDFSYVLPLLPAQDPGEWLSSDALGNMIWADAIASLTNWIIHGNALQNTVKWLGTTNTNPMRFKVQNTISGLITRDGQASWGFKSASIFTGGDGTAIGFQAMQFSTSSNHTTAVGYNAFRNNLSGHATAFGKDALMENTDGDDNHGFGAYALASTTTGAYNTALGWSSANINVTGGSNSSTGLQSFKKLTSGSFNAALGTLAGGGIISGSNNTFAGYLAGAASGALTNATAIGYNASVSSSNSLVLGGTGVDAVFVGIGVSAPTAALHVNGSVDLSTLSGSGTRSVQVNATGVVSARTDNSLRLTGKSGTTASTSAIGVVANNNFMGTTDNIDFVFATNNLERLRISNAGNVGLGTLTPNAKLNINGSFALRRNNVTCVNGANNNLNVGTYSFIRITGPTAAFSITGITGGANGDIVTIYNSTAQNMTISNNITSTAANQILTLTGANITTIGTGTVTMRYDSAASRWVVIYTQT